MTNPSSKALIQTYVKLLLEQFHKDPEINKFFEELDNFRAAVESIPYKDMSSTQQNHFLNLGNDIWSVVKMNPNDIVLHNAQDRLKKLKLDVNLVLSYVLFTDVNKKSTKPPTPEAPKNAPYGQYLFAPDRADIKYKVNEPNTPREQQLLNQLHYHYNADSNALGKYAPEVINMINKGYYKKILAPPKKTVYRLLWNVSPEAAAGLLNLDVEEIIEQANKPWYVEGGGTINGNKGKNIQSWTTTMSTEWIIELLERELRPGTAAIVLAAHTEGNSFFINPKGAEQVDGLPTSLIKKEQEVISHGPVNFFEASFFYKIIDKNDFKKQTDDALRFIGQIHELLVNETDHIIEAYENYINNDQQDPADIKDYKSWIKDFQYLKTTNKMFKNISTSEMTVWSLPANIREQIFNIAAATLGERAAAGIFRIYLETWKYGGPFSEKAVEYVRQKIATFYQDVYDANRTKKSIVGIVSQLSKAMKFKLKK